MEARVFHSKILLFGEYSIIDGSMGLSIPYPEFNGHLTFPSESNRSYSIQESNRELAAMCTDLKETRPSFSFDVKNFEYDIEQGLFFDSTIPQGYGVGSSGALCAALYDRYACRQENGRSREMTQLMSELAELESHFHGVSSGMDPLISYLDHPLLISEKEKIQFVELPQLVQGEGAVFLLNTGRPRQTGPLVQLFFEKKEQSDFRRRLHNELIPMTHQCIHSFLQGDKVALWPSVKQLSSWQLQHFSPMIPRSIRKHWRDGLDSDLFYLKLCGAGGGGLFLGFTRSFDMVLEMFRASRVKTLFPF